jgi:hypothetical protein
MPVEHAEDDSWHGEEVHGCDRFPVVAQEGEPTLRWLRVSWRSFHATGDRSFGDVEPEHEQLAMNSWRTPSCILGNHLEDQVPHLRRSLPSPERLLDSENQCPIQTEAGSMPSDHRLRRDDDKNLLPL